MSAGGTSTGFDIGDRIHFALSIARSTGINSTLSTGPSDPTSLIFRLLNPADVEILTSTWTSSGGSTVINRSTIGEFNADYTVDASGPWFYRWEAFGAAEGAEERRVTVRDSVFST